MIMQPKKYASMTAKILISTIIIVTIFINLVIWLKGPIFFYTAGWNQGLLAPSCLLAALLVLLTLIVIAPMIWFSAWLYSKLLDSIIVIKVHTQKIAFEIAAITTIAHIIAFILSTIAKSLFIFLSPTLQLKISLFNLFIGLLIQFASFPVTFITVWFFAGLYKLIRRS